MMGWNREAESPWQRFARRHWAWIVVIVTVLFTLAVRVRLREMPLERDEGEYAYAGQLILHGIAPYKAVYVMKLPGTYAAYGLIMAVFGQSAAGIHFGVALVNAASTILVFLLGRKLLDDVTGAASAVAFALMSLSPSMLGLAAHATHFVVLPALAGMLLLVRALKRGVEERNPKSEIRNKFEREGESRKQEPEETRFTHNESRFTFHAPPTTIFLTAGAFFGLAFLMKQHGVFFGVFGAIYLVGTYIARRVASEQLEAALPTHPGRNPNRAQRQTSNPPIHQASPPPSARQLAFDFGAFTLGFLLPYGFTCVVLWRAGALPQFIFWTISYAGKYASAIPIVRGADVLKAGLNSVVGPNLVLWILPWVGALVMWWEQRLDSGAANSARHFGGDDVRKVAMEPAGEANPKSEIRNPKTAMECPRFFLTALLLCSFASVSIGLYFREHYFILLLPALALLSGVAVSRGVHLLQHDQTIELFLAIPILGLLVIAVGAAVIGNGSVWFGMTPVQACEDTYRSALFPAAVTAAEFIESNASPDARIAVLGSEPEIYFYARRRAVTGYIYMYPLLEEHEFARKMQAEMIGEIERGRPEYVVYVEDDFSWLPRPNSERKIFDWWQNYWGTELNLVKTIEFEEGVMGDSAGAMVGRGGPKGETTRQHLLIFKRRTH